MKINSILATSAASTAVVLPILAGVPAMAQTSGDVRASVSVGHSCVIDVTNADVTLSAAAGDDTATGNFPGAVTISQNGNTTWSLSATTFEANPGGTGDEGSFALDLPSGQLTSDLSGGSNLTEAGALSGEGVDMAATIGSDGPFLANDTYTIKATLTCVSDGGGDGGGDNGGGGGASSSS